MPAAATEGISQTTMVDGSSFHYRVIGSGTPLLLVHGWPFHGESFLPLARHLAADFQCWMIDLPGLGKTGFSENTDFSFTGLAQILRQFTDTVIGSDYACVAHDTGATVARFLALADKRLKKLALLNTEIPGHRPPWIELFQRLLALPGARWFFQWLLSQELFLRSPLGYGGCFEDRGLIDAKFKEQFVTPLTTHPDRLEGALRYLGGIDFRLMDTLAQKHRDLDIPVALIWGENDETFPIDEGRKMTAQFRHLEGFYPIAGTRLMLHLEKPDAVAARITEFLKK